MRILRISCALLIATSSLVGMRHEGFDKSYSIRDRIMRLVRECRAEFEVPTTVSLKLALGNDDDLPTSDGIRAMAGLKIGKKELFDKVGYKSISPECAPYLAFMIFSTKFTEFSRGLQRGTILKRLYNIIQISQEHRSAAFDAISYPKGLCQEAIAQTILHLKCATCVREYMESLPIESPELLTQSEAAKLLERMDQTQLCAYHKRS